MRTCLLAALLATAGCQAGPKMINVAGEKPLNRNKYDEDVPVEVRIYYLRDDQNFIKAKLADLWANAKQVLGADLVDDPKQVTVLPGQNRQWDIGVMKPEVRYVGLAALYSGDPGSGGRQHVVVPAERAGDFTFAFTGYRVEPRKR